MSTPAGPSDYADPVDDDLELAEVNQDATEDEDMEEATQDVASVETEDDDDEVVREIQAAIASTRAVFIATAVA